MRELVACLAGLNLLEVDRLAADGDEDPGPMLERLIIGYGIAPAHASTAVRAILDAAASVRNRFDGHIQRYLRLYGERMLAEIGNHFRFSAMDDEAVARVFTHWLQNAVAMPLSQMGAPVKSLARTFDSTPEAAREAADEVGMGLALFDDIVIASHAEDDEADG